MSKVKSVYPKLAEWIGDSGITEGALIDALHMTPMAYLNRLRGTTPFSGIEAEKLEQMSGIPANELLRREA